MKILTIGDIFGRVGRDSVFTMLDRMAGSVDFIIANAENASHGRGLTKPVYEELKSAGINVFTTGNHVWGCPDIESVMRYNDDIIRPANFEGDIPGCGSCVLKARNGVLVGVINLIGRTYMQAVASSPFFACDSEIEKLKEKTDIIIVDFHAEATSEKEALGYYLDGEVSAVLGTHTHIQTADERILPQGTAYITDVGRSGARDSVLGLDKDASIARFTMAPDDKKPPFNVARGKSQLCAVVIDIDEKTGLAEGIKRLCVLQK